MSNEKQFAHTFHYDTVAEFITQLEETREKLLGSVALEPYEVVRARYPHLKRGAFCMRLRRFMDSFPKAGRYTGNRHGITQLFVTTELHEYLNRPCRRGIRVSKRYEKKARKKR